ncbi:hypothetical protein M378DRAFT_79097, partial [Amanita muscaria Koide BX008]
KVPNTVLAMIDLRHTIRVFFPGLMNTPRKSSCLTDEESQTFYDHGILPAVQNTAATIVRDWPPSYQSEKFRASNGRGHYQESTHVLSVDDVPEFSHQLRQWMDQVPWGQNMVFGTEIRGKKDATEHQPFRDDALTSLTNAFDDVFYPGDNIDGHWWVDVAIELQLKRKAVVWRAGCATPILQSLQFDNHEIDLATQNKRLYEEDVCQHLLEVAGFRARMPRELSPYQISYVQAYTTDKSLTYHLAGGGVAKQITAVQAMATSQEGGPPYVQGLYDSYTSARGKIDVAARLEVRVPYAQAAAVLLRFPRDVFLKTTLVFPRELWWYVYSNDCSILQVYSYTI